MRGEAAVEADDAFLDPHKFQTLHEASVLGPAARTTAGSLPQPRPRDLVGICQNAGDTLGGASAEKVTGPFDGVVPPGAAALGIRRHPGRDEGLARPQFPLDLLVQHPVQRALCDAQVARAEALEESSGSFVLESLPDAVPRIPVPPEGPGIAPAGGPLGTGTGVVVLICRHLGSVVFVELQPRLNQPDGIRNRSGGNAGRDCARKVDHGPFTDPVLPLPAEQARVDPLSGSVDVKITAARGHNANQIRT